MNSTRWRIVLALLAILAPAVIARADAPATAPASSSAGSGQKIVDAFAKAMQDSNGFDAAAKADAVKLLEAAPTDTSAQAELLASALSRLYPDFAKAMTALGDEDNDTAIAALKPLAGASDPYLAAHATFFLGRAYVANEEFEAALPLVSDVADKFSDRTLYAGEAAFLKGVCQRKVLQRKEAVKTFADFIRKYPDAPERLQVGALHQIYELQLMQDGTLDDVADRMDFSGNRLDRLHTDKPVTQAEQARIVAILDKMIKDKEDEENKKGDGSGDGSSRSRSRGRGPRQNVKRSSNPATESSIRPGAADDPNLKKLRGDGDRTWVQDKKRERDKVLDTHKGEISDRERELIEQYFQNLMEPGKAAEAPPK